MFGFDVVHHHSPRQNENVQNKTFYREVSPAIITDRYRDVSPGSWKKVYFVEPTEEIIQNKITISPELLEEEKYYIDLLNRRDTFIEKPKPMPKIMHTKPWEPPEEIPYQFPQPRAPFKEFRQSDDKEHKWEPYLVEPEYKYEKSLFYPMVSPTQIPSERGSIRMQHKPLPQPETEIQPETYTQPQATTQQPPVKPPRTQTGGRGPFSGFSTVPIYNVQGTDSNLYEFRSSPRPFAGRDGVAPNENISYRHDGNLYELRSSPRSFAGRDGVPSNENLSYRHDGDRMTNERSFVSRSANATPGVPENESTPRHPSTLTIFDRPHVDLNRKIEIFEPQVSDPRSTPKHEFGVPLQMNQSDDRISAVTFVEPSINKFSV